MNKSLLTALASTVFAGWAHAQAVPADDAASAAASAVQAHNATGAIAALLQADLSIPASPAAALLGISGDKVQHPGTVRELAGSVIRGIGPDGKPTSAIALDIAPVFLFAPTFVGAGSDYAKKDATDDWDAGLDHWGKRVLARTTLSFGTTDPDSNGATTSAVGIRVGLFDSGDPGLYWSQTIDCIAKTARPLPPPPPKEGVSQPAQEIAVDFSQCDPTKSTDGALWKKPSLYAGYGQSWYSKSGALTDHAPDVKQFWLTGSAGWSPASSDMRVLGQLYLARRLDDRTPDPDDATQLLRQDSSDAIVRLRAGRTKWHAFVEVGRSRVQLGDSTRQDLRHTALGAEFQLAFLGADNWLEVANVSDHGYRDGKSHSGVTLSFRMGTPALALPTGAAITQKQQ